LQFNINSPNIVGNKKTNTVKKLITLVLALITFSAMAQSTNPIQITINGQTDRGALWQIHEDLKAQGLNFIYNPSFDNQRRLVKLSYSVQDAAGNEVIANTDVPGNFQQGAMALIKLKKVNNHWVKE
jgi:hypothetical protein